MPTIRPTDVSDCSKLINKHRDEIIKGVYEIEIDREWVNKMGNPELLFLAEHSKARYSTLSRIATEAKAENVLEVLAQHPDYGIKSHVAENKNTPASVLAILARDSSAEVRKLVADHANTSVDSLGILARDADYSVQKVVAESEITPAEVLEVLAKDRSQFMRALVARHPNASVAMLERLSDDSNPEVRITIIYNRKTPAELLKKLMRDSDKSVRSSMAQSLKSSPDLEQLASDSESDVRLMVAKNPHTPVKALKLLAHDSAISVRDAAKQHSSYKALGFIERWLG